MQKQILEAVHEAAGKLETASEELKRELEELNEELTKEYIAHSGACLCLLRMASHAQCKQDNQGQLQSWPFSCKGGTDEQDHIYRTCG